MCKPHADRFGSGTDVAGRFKGVVSGSTIDQTRREVPPWSRCYPNGSRLVIRRKAYERQVLGVDTAEHHARIGGVCESVHGMPNDAVLRHQPTGRSGNHCLFRRHRNELRRAGRYLGTSMAAIPIFTLQIRFFLAKHTIIEHRASINEHKYTILEHLVSILEHLIAVNKHLVSILQHIVSINKQRVSIN